MIRYSHETTRKSTVYVSEQKPLETKTYDRNENSTGGLKNKGEAAFQKQQWREGERGRERGRAQTGQRSGPDTWIRDGARPAHDQPVGARQGSVPAAGSCQDRPPPHRGRRGQAAERLPGSTESALQAEAVGLGLSLRKLQVGGPGKGWRERVGGGQRPPRLALAQKASSCFVQRHPRGPSRPDGTLGNTTVSHKTVPGRILEIRFRIGGKSVCKF